MKFQRATLVLATTVTLLCAVPAGAVAAPTWKKATLLALPTGATGIYSGYLPALACPSANNCLASGEYSDASGVVRGLLAEEVNGVWKTPATLQAPTGAVLADGVTIYGAACGSVGNCSVVGTYTDAHSSQLSFTDDEVAGVWAKAATVTMPANALSSSSNDVIHSVACSSAGNCSAVGTYQVSGANSLLPAEGFVVDEVNGKWSDALEVTLPNGTNADPFTSLGQIACASPGNCAAVGSYIDANNVTRAIMVTEVNRTWHAATTIVTPGNASAYAGASLNEVSCVAPGTCTAVGTYNVAGGGVHAMAVTETNGVVAHAVEIALPTNASNNPSVLLYGFDGIACTSAGNCASGGQYMDKNSKYQGFLVNEVQGQWQTATEMTLPSGAQQAGKNGGVVSVSCSATGSCNAGAAYLDASGNYQAYIVSEVNHVWKSGSKISLPGSGTTVGIYGGVYALVCQRSGACNAVGSYLSNSATYSGFSVATA